MLAIAPGQSLGQMVRLLLKTALDRLQAHAIPGLACLAVERSVREALNENGFIQTDRVINYTLPGRKPLALRAEARPATLRLARPSDVDAILDINRPHLCRSGVMMLRQ